MSDIIRINIDALLAPIPGNNPAGSSVDFLIQQKLNDYRVEIDPKQYSDNDPLRPERPQPANWQGIIDLCTETLTTSSKSLIIAARLTEALTMSQGFTGLRNGLILLRRLVSDCWDRLFPALEVEEDLEGRALPFDWLNNRKGGSYLPGKIEQLTLLASSTESFTYDQWKKNLKRESIENIIQVSKNEDCMSLGLEIEACSLELKALDDSTTEKMKEFAPSFSNLREAIQNCQTLTEQIKKRKGVVEVEKPNAVDQTGPEVTGAPTASTTVTSTGVIERQMQSREQIYKQLAEAARLLEKLEPHSPIPYLIKHSVELGELSFPQLMQRLLQNGDVLKDLNRRLGIKSPES